ncbi:MAG: GGDEF domain-containing protein [Spirochaetales bacterium]|nr:GGDEF domain-containing protein [Spirochaetales bacterium]
MRQYNKLVRYFLEKKEDHISRQEKKEFEEFIKINEGMIYSKIFFEYSQLEIDNKRAKDFLENVVKNKMRLEAAMNTSFDFRVSFLDYLIRNINSITQASEPRIIEDKIFRNLNQLIVKDELTGLFNFRHYENELEKEFSRARRYDHPFSLVIMDIDDFKIYNDKFGHIEGNHVLQKISQIILESVRITDIPCRYGGEEFAIILPQTGSEGAYFRSEKIRETVEQQKFRQKLTISGGIAVFPDDTDRSDRTLFEYADKALYYSKEKGKNRVTRFSAEFLSKIL